MISEPQFLLSKLKLNLLKLVKLFRNCSEKPGRSWIYSLCTALLPTWHCVCVCESRINSSVTPVAFRGGWGWCLTSGQISMRLFASSVEEFGLFAIQRLSRDREEAPLVSLACFCEHRDHCWCTPNMHNVFLQAGQSKPIITI